MSNYLHAASSSSMSAHRGGSSSGSAAEYRHEHHRADRWWWWWWWWWWYRLTWTLSWRWWWWWWWWWWWCDILVLRTRSRLVPSFVTKMARDRAHTFDNGSAVLTLALLQLCQPSISGCRISLGHRSWGWGV